RFRLPRGRPAWYSRERFATTAQVLRTHASQRGPDSRLHGSNVMTRTTDSGRPGGLSVPDLFAKYLKKQIDAHAAGLGHAESSGDAVPHEATPIQPIDPALAWKDATATAKLLGAQLTFDAPPDWPTLVGRQEPAVALAFALGNFPQLVRNLHVL